ncbi:MAG: hypothetical protein KJ822_11340, partial [Proteobacteria bacterium]|nr:hypothetical protein [Pseudomonadota bacterium]
GFKGEILRCAQNDKNSLLIAHWYEIAATRMAQGGHHRVTPAFLQCQEDQPVCRVATVQP